MPGEEVRLCPICDVARLAYPVLQTRCTGPSSTYDTW
jgi:hypothetical protein